MTPLRNPFKHALAEGRPQIGFWLGLASAYSAEICAGAGFDWLLVDGEHAPNDLGSMLAQLQAVDAAAALPEAPTRPHAVVRIAAAHGELAEVLVKQHLDIGAQTILVPMVETPAQAAALVRATCYPPEGVRGMAGARASRWGRVADYAHHANREICLLTQAESRLALMNLDAIAETEGVDGVFIGPADLSASMGHPGEASHPDVLAAIEDAISRIRRAGKAAGILATDEALARRYLALGATFVAVGLDTVLLARETSALAARFRSGAPP